jgi:tetratricopeptide (TPR) repeat protein
VIEHLVHFNSKKIFVFLSLFALTQISAQVYPDKSIHNTLKAGIKLIVEQKYNDAQKLFDQFDKSRSDLPLGKIYLAATQIAKCFDYQEPFNDELITPYLESAKSISESLLNKDDKNIWYNYFFALTQGYIAYYDALKEDWFSAFSNGLISVRAFDYCLELDQNFYESFIAIGNYKFWRSKKTEFLNWLPFVPDEKELGIDYLKKAINQSGYNSHLAIHSLIWIYIEQEEYSKAIEIADSALKRNPQSRLIKWGLARAYENVEPVKAVALYGEILLSYPTDLILNKINEVTLKHLIAQQEAKLGKKQQALDLCNEILGIKGYNDFELNKLNNRLGRVRDLKNELMLK